MSATITSLPTATNLPSAPLPSFREIYQKNVAFVWSYAARRGVPRAYIEDVVQEVFLAVHQSLASFAGKSTLRAWIAGVVRHVTIAHLRRNSFGAGLLRPEEDSECFRDTVTPAEIADRNERVAVIVNILDDMTELSREAYWLYEIEERPGSEVAEVLGVSENTVRMRVRTARRSLRPVVTRFRESA